MKVYVKQGSTSWEEEFVDMETFESAISANPYNYESNGYRVTNNKGELIAENVYFLGMEDEDDEEVMYTSEELNDQNGVNRDWKRISIALAAEINE